MDRPPIALTFQKPDGQVIGLFARGTGIGITFEITKAVNAVQYDSIQVVGPTYASEQLALTAIANAGGEVNLIKSLLTVINAALKAIFGSSAPPAPGGNVVDKLNQALASSFEFYMDATGAVQLKAK